MLWRRGDRCVSIDRGNTRRVGFQIYSHNKVTKTHRDGFRDSTSDENRREDDRPEELLGL